MTFILKSKETQVGFLYDHKHYSSLIKRFVRTPRLSFFVRWIAGVALASLIMLIAVLPLVGVLLGLCGGNEKVKPTERGCASNCGGILLMRWVWTVCSCVMAVPDWQRESQSLHSQNYRILHQWKVEENQDFLSWVIIQIENYNSHGDGDW